MQDKQENRVVLHPFVLLQISFALGIANCMLENDAWKFTGMCHVPTFEGRQ